MRWMALGVAGLSVASCWTAQDDDRCTGVVSVATGFTHSYAVKADGSAWQWGGWPDGTVRPQRIPGITTATGAPGRGAACFQTDSGLVCRGWSSLPTNTLQVDNSVDPLGNCYGECHFLDCPDSGCGPPPHTSPSSCVLDASQQLSCYLVGREIVSLAGIRQAAVGWDHLCAIRVDGTVFCQANLFGSLNGEFNPELVTQMWSGDVPSLGTEVAKLVSSGESACALKRDGTLWCWGFDSYGEAALGGTSTATPTYIDALGAEVASISMGREHACAIKRDGTLWCWGNINHQSFGMPRHPPAPVTGLPMPVTDVAAGELHTCAVAGEGELFCWGMNDLGELGTGDSGTGTFPLNLFGIGKASEAPVPVLGCP